MVILTPERLRVWQALIPTLAELPAAPKRIILHWTGGGPKANDVDLAHYHYVVTQPNGAVARGAHPVSRNMRNVSGTAYAMHTGGFNSYSVGVSFAGMLNATPARVYGPYPLVEQQVLSGLAFVAMLCRAWGLDPENPAHLFTHYEAWTIHGVKGAMNDRKFDITFLQFRPELRKDDVGPWLRATTGDFLRTLLRQPVPET
jgi:hypothetical protein